MTQSKILRETLTDACPDRLVEQWFESVKHLNVIPFSTDTQFVMLRCFHREGKINIDSVETLDGDTLDITDSGRLYAWPDGFMDKQENYLYRLL